MAGEQATRAELDAHKAAKFGGEYAVGPRRARAAYWGSGYLWACAAFVGALGAYLWAKLWGVDLDDAVDALAQAGTETAQNIPEVLDVADPASALRDFHDFVEATGPPYVAVPSTEPPAFLEAWKSAVEGGAVRIMASPEEFVQFKTYLRTSQDMFHPAAVANPTMTFYGAEVVRGA